MLIPGTTSKSWAVTRSASNASVMDGWSGAVAGAGMMCRPEAPIRYSSSAARSCAGEKLFTPRRGGTPSSIDRKNGRRRESGGEGFISLNLADHSDTEHCSWVMSRYLERARWGEEWCGKV